jgi:regulator of telomere elongation helicase 1
VIGGVLLFFPSYQMLDHYTE